MTTEAGPVPFIVYNPATGEIVRTGIAPDEAHVGIQARDGEVVVRGSCDPMKSRIVKGRVQPLPSEKVELLRNPPSLFHQWDWNRLIWEDPRTVAQIKAFDRGQIINQIAAVEANQSRAVREALLAGDKTRLQELEAQISGLRSRLNQLN